MFLGHIKVVSSLNFIYIVLLFILIKMTKKFLQKENSLIIF